MIILAIDPGVHACACALVRDGMLEAVWFWPSLTRYDPPVCAVKTSLVDRVVVERPEYQGARSDASRTGDLIDLAWAGAACAYAVGAPVVEVPPSEWIRGESKPPKLARLWHRTLTHTERALFPAHTEALVYRAANACALKPGRPGAAYYGRGKGSDVHNLLDACALGLWYVERFR